MRKDKTKSLIHLHFLIFLWGFTSILGSVIPLDSTSLVWLRMTIAAALIALFFAFFSFQFSFFFFPAFLSCTSVHASFCCQFLKGECVFVQRMTCLFEGSAAQLQYLLLYCLYPLKILQPTHQSVSDHIIILIYID